MRIKTQAKEQQCSKALEKALRDKKNIAIELISQYGEADAEELIQTMKNKLTSTGWAYIEKQINEGQVKLKPLAFCFNLGKEKWQPIRNLLLRGRLRQDMGGLHGLAAAIKLLLEIEEAQKNEQVKYFKNLPE